MKTIMTSITTVLCVGSLMGCASKNMGSAASGDKVLSRAEGYSSTPEWAIIQPRFIENDTIYVSGGQDISGDQSPSRGCTASDVQAKANLISEIKTRLQSQLQLANENFDYDQSTLRQIINSATEVKFVTGLQISRRYYEKTLNETAHDKQVRYSCYSLAALPMEEFKRNVIRALRESEGRNQLSEDFKSRVNKSYDKFFDETTNAPAIVPAPSMAETAKEENN